MATNRRDQTDKPSRKNDARILIALLGGTLAVLLIVIVLVRQLAGGLAQSATPTLAPSPTVVTGAAVVQQIQRLSRLETSSYSIQTVVTVERPGGLFGIGRQKVLVVVQGTVVAGIDLSKLRPEDVTVSPDGKRIKLRMPDAEILSRYLDEGATQLYDHQTGLFTQPDSSLVIEAQQMGMSRVMQAACDGGVMKRATDNGQQSLRDVLMLLGFENVEFENKPIPPCMPDV